MLEPTKRQQLGLKTPCETQGRRLGLCVLPTQGTQGLCVPQSPCHSSPGGNVCWDLACVSGGKAVQAT